MIDCDVKLKMPHLEGMNSTVCRKIIHKGEMLLKDAGSLKLMLMLRLK